MNNILLISEKTLKSQSYINNNVDSCYILPAIQTAQDIGLQQLIGTMLYDKLTSDIANDRLDDNYKKLLDDYITPYLIYKVLANIQVPLAFKNRNAGVVKTSDDNITVVDMDDAKVMSSYYDKTASFYGIRLTNFLCANNNIYPEYRSVSSIADLRADRDAYNTGIFLGSECPYDYLNMPDRKTKKQ